MQKLKHAMYNLVGLKLLFVQLQIIKICTIIIDIHIISIKLSLSQSLIIDNFSY